MALFIRLQFRYFLIIVLRVRYVDGLLHYLFFAWKFMKASVEASLASMEVSIASMQASTEASRKLLRKLPRKLPRIRKLPRKPFHGILGCSSMEASGSLHERSEAQRLTRKLPRKLFVKAFEVASTKVGNVGSYIHGILCFTSMEASAASTESQRLPRQLPRIYLYCTLVRLQ